MCASIQSWNEVTIFHEIGYKHYANEGHPTYKHFNLQKISNTMTNA
jgi:hypothetical protein